jgi:hypothetical protein
MYKKSWFGAQAMRYLWQHSSQRWKSENFSQKMYHMQRPDHASTGACTAAHLVRSKAGDQKIVIQLHHQKCLVQVRMFMKANN